MKKSFAVVLFLFLISSLTFAQKKIIVRGEYFVTEDLILRSAPSSDAKKIATLPKHTVVYEISKGPAQKIDDKTVQWKKVICDRFESERIFKAGTIGWILSDYLAKEDKYSDEEIEEILFNAHGFSIGRESVHGFSFGNYEKGKTITAFIDADMPGCYESTSSTFHVKDGKIIIDKPFEISDNIDWSWANDCFYNEEGINYVTLERVHSTEGEFCLIEYEGYEFYSEPKNDSLILEDGVLICTENVSIILPCDCVFYSEPDFASEKVSFPDYIFIEDDDDVLVYNLDRAFTGQNVSAFRWLVNEESYNGECGRWYCLNEICNTDKNPVWIFVPGPLDTGAEQNVKEIPLTIQTFTDAQNKGILRFRIITEEDYKLIYDTHHHMNPWIDSCLDTFPDP